MVHFNKAPYLIISHHPPFFLCHSRLTILLHFSNCDKQVRKHGITCFGQYYFCKGIKFTKLLYRNELFIKKGTPEPLKSLTVKTVKIMFR